MIPTWTFVVLLTMASFGGNVHITVTAQTEAACNKLRRVAVKFGIDERNVTPCVSSDPAGSQKRD